MDTSLEDAGWLGDPKVPGQLRYHNGRGWTKHKADGRPRQLYRCPSCHLVVPETKYVTFQQNVAIILARFPTEFTGHLCKTCVHKRFWEMNTISLFFGWWGIMSIFLNPIGVLSNIAQYFSCRKMQSPRQLVATA